MPRGPSAALAGTKPRRCWVRRALLAWSVLAELSSVAARVGLARGEVLAPSQHLLVLLGYTAVRNWHKMVFKQEPNYCCCSKKKSGWLQNTCYGF